MSCLYDLIKEGKPFTLTATDLEGTHALGKELGTLATPGTVICLSGDLGSGKTSFVQGLAMGLDVPSDLYVTSPSYTLINEYPGRIPLYHLDLYRLTEAEDLFDLGVDEILSGQGVVAIEWPEKLPPGILDDPIRIDISIMRDDTRRFYFRISGVDLDGQI
ncbi:MAG: tRNA (adenosine(37)-N6)-threonylcarbamoyltransferase complex ATPase subunit type 1 TsaE [Proteobacteria bacterium]|nr:tRNA (adenosine(37)-N6)-threonylcarbamoyltransferase complex ATPase subunit type 1 TsaE [Pseudomonadota bacterium]